MKRIFFFVLIVCHSISTTSFSRNSSPNEKIRIWEGVGDASVKKANSEFTVFYPRDRAGTHPAVIICPGGSYAYLGMKIEGSRVAHWLNSRGFVAFVLRYRIGMEGYHYPAEIQDLQRTIELVRENAGRWNVDPDKIGVMGFSAGGHLAGTAAVYSNENFMSTLGIHSKVSLKPNFIAMIYPVVSMHDSIAHRKSRFFLFGRKQHSELLENKLSLEDHVNREMPPVFIVHASGDKTVNCKNSICFSQNMQKLGLPVKFLLYDGPGHGFGVDKKKNPIATEWTKEFENWVHCMKILY